MQSTEVLTKDENKKILQVKGDNLFHDLFNENDITTLEWVVSKILMLSMKILKEKLVF